MTNDQVWDAIVRMATISHSETSNQQRAIAKARQKLKQNGLGAPEPIRELKARPTIDCDTGRVIDKIS